MRIIFILPYKPSGDKIGIWKGGDSIEQNLDWNGLILCTSLLILELVEYSKSFNNCQRSLESFKKCLRFGDGNLPKLSEISRITFEMPRASK